MGVYYCKSDEHSGLWVIRVNRSMLMRVKGS